MKKLLSMMLALMLAFQLLPVAGVSAAEEQGTVLYHQDTPDQRQRLYEGMAGQLRHRMGLHCQHG